MNDYFTNIYSRNFDIQGNIPKVRPRLPSFYEPVIETFNSFTAEDLNQFELKGLKEGIITNASDNAHKPQGSMSIPQTSIIKQSAAHSDQSDVVNNSSEQIQAGSVAQLKNKALIIPDNTVDYMLSEKSEKRSKIRSAPQIYEATQEEPHITKTEKKVKNQYITTEKNKEQKSTQIQHVKNKMSTAEMLCYKDNEKKGIPEQKDNAQIESIKPEKKENKKDFLNKNKKMSQVPKHRYETQTNIRNDIHITDDVQGSIDSDDEKKEVVSEVVNRIIPTIIPVLSNNMHSTPDNRTGLLSFGIASTGNDKFQIRSGQKSDVSQSIPMQIQSNRKILTPHENINNGTGSIIVKEKVVKQVEMNNGIEGRVRSVDNRTSGEIVKPAIYSSTPDFRNERNTFRSGDVRSVEPTIHVTIGRIEVRSGSSPVQSRPKSNSATPMSLEEYFKKRNGGA